MSVELRRVRFEGGAGATLSGWLHQGEGRRGALLLTHCFTCGKDLPLYRGLAAGLAERGFPTLRFDLTGLGQSEGDFSRTTLETNVEDVRRALAELRAQLGEPLGAIGHSLGGTATLLAAPTLPSLAALAVLASPAEPAGLERRLGRDVRAEAEAQGSAAIEVGGRPFRVGRELLDSLHGLGLGARLAALGRPLLFLHGTLDHTVPIEDSEALFAAAAQPKGFEPLVGADHLLGRRQDVEAAVEILAAWFGRHLAAAPAR